MKKKETKENRKKKRRLLLLLLICLLIFLNLCNRRTKIEPIVEPVKEPVEKPIVLEDKIEKKFTKLYKSYPQIVKEILVKNNDSVTSGAILIIFDTSEKDKLIEEKNNLKIWYENHLKNYRKLEKKVEEAKKQYKLDDHGLNSQLAILEVEEKEFNLGGSSKEDLKFIRDYVASLEVIKEESGKKYRSLKKELENYGIDKIKKKYLTRTKEINEILPLIIDNIKSPLDGGVEKVEVKVEKVAEKEQLLITLYEVVKK